MLVLLLLLEEEDCAKQIESYIVYDGFLRQSYECSLKLSKVVRMIPLRCSDTPTSFTGSETRRESFGEASCQHSVVRQKPNDMCYSVKSSKTIGSYPTSAVC